MTMDRGHHGLDAEESPEQVASAIVKGLRYLEREATTADLALLEMVIGCALRCYATKSESHAAARAAGQCAMPDQHQGGHEHDDC
jgi:hypothetical protein